MNARLCMFAAVLAVGACRKSPDALVVVSLTADTTIATHQVTVRVSRLGGKRLTEANFSSPQAHQIGPGMAATFGLEVSGDVQAAYLSIEVTDKGPWVATGMSGPVAIHAGQRTDVPILLTVLFDSPPPDGSADSPDGGMAEGPPDAGAPEAATPDAPTDAPSVDVLIETAPEAPVEVRPEVHPPGSTTDLNTKLVAWWKMDEESGYTAHDSSKNGNDATLHDLFDGVAWPSGHLGSSFRPAGSGWLSTKDSASFQTITDEISVAVWINQQFLSLNEQNRQTGRRTILQWQRGMDVLDELWLGIFNNKLEVSIGSSATYDVAMMPEDKDVHVAVTFSPTTMKVYVDGALSVEDKMPQYFIAKQPRWFNVAGSCHGADANVVTDVASYVEIDDLMIYARALAGPDVFALANNARPTP